MSWARARICDSVHFLNTAAALLTFSVSNYISIIINNTSVIVILREGYRQDRQ